MSGHQFVMPWSRAQQLREPGLAVLAAVLALGITASSAGLTSSELDVAAVDISSLSPTLYSTGRQTSTEVRYLLRWITATGDNGSLQFFVIDKKSGTAHAFDAQQRWLASTPVLVGSASGDDTVSGIGTRPLSLVKAHERTTPAGRFVGELGINTAGESVVWVDYDAGVSMHSVRTTNASEHRLQRLASSDAEQRRISYGCVNFPDAFFNTRVLPVFAHNKALVYVLPDVKSIDSVFGLPGPQPLADGGADDHAVRVSLKK